MEFTTVAEFSSTYWTILIDLASRKLPFAVVRKSLRKAVFFAVLHAVRIMSDGKYSFRQVGLAVRLAGGFRGGYPTAGVGVELLRVFTLDLVTWAEELGYYTGQDEERVYMAQISLGF